MGGTVTGSDFTWTVKVTGKDSTAAQKFAPELTTFGQQQSEYEAAPAGID